MRDVGAPPGHPVLSERWQEAGVSAAVGRVCFVVGSGEQIEYEVGSAVSHDLSKGFVAGSSRAVVGGVEKGGRGVETYQLRTASERDPPRLLQGGMGGIRGGAPVLRGYGRLWRFHGAGSGP